MFFVIVLISTSEGRASLKNFFSKLMHNRIVIAGIFTTLYSSIIIAFIYFIGLVDESNLKTILVWVITVPYYVTFQSISDAEDNSYFRKTFLKAISIVVFLECMINFYTFSIAIELVLVVIILLLTFIVAIYSYDKKDEYKTAGDGAGCLLKLTGLILFIYSVIQLINNFADLSLILYEVLISVILSILLIPFSYLFACIARYETIFNRLDFLNTIDSKAKSKIKKRIIRLCKLNLTKIAKFNRQGHLFYYDLTTDDIINKFFKDYISKHT
ncbi:hypothetical protein [Alkalicoccobacillus gibsonii]|uniref:hypothetical protein n=1 Tax=Alkalicoccobacillus gibsonii TaxID=79881 RepID=UPI0019343AFF|nr:hypothetical protein [Alkalicoccobacillus gibsonii]MBM0064905.1 hypothetical protein [Alkalicoccobacillus gibsonii]